MRCPLRVKLLDQVRDKTEKFYIGWMKRYIIFHNKRHPQEMGKNEVEQFLTWLAVKQTL